MSDVAWIKALIESEGRSCTLSKFGAAKDETKPWRGHKDPDEDEDQLQVKAVFVKFKVNEIDGEIVRRGDQYAFCAGDTAADGYELLIDGTEVWKIVGADKIAPGEEILLYRLHLRR
ncbi:hypothetical protein M0R72_08755 [Candidatus Pacearchaeota archaeon]|jgi:hypothetical protein|nr:hypothetical protein [Candidatus Pacearchaeota archaeon]